MTIKMLASATFLTGTLLLACAANGALAAPASSERDTITLTMADAAQARPAAATEDDESVSCNKSRKRLWVEGEGWIVRRVTTCR